MSRKYNILIFPAGTEIGLEINNALKYSKILNVFGATSEPNHAKFVYKNYIDGLPYFNDCNFIKALNKVVEENNIEYIYPAHDSVGLFLTQQKDNILAQIITSELETVEICRSKKRTYDYLQENDFIPTIYNSIDAVEEFPVFIKPDVGQGSVGAKKVFSKTDLNEKEIANGIVVCEWLEGPEYTVDCFSDMHGKLRVCKLRSRDRIKVGISVNSKLCNPNSEVKKIAETINSKLRFNGVWFFQLKLNEKDEFKLLEISPRIPGTMGLSRNLGINFPLLTIYNHLNFEIGIVQNNYNIEVDRAFISRYNIDISYDVVYLDLDDTLILRDKVNSYLMMFLYQCLNNNIKIKLISRHREEISGTLTKFKINESLFEEIIHIKGGTKKSEYIKERNSIFIDDSFAERKDVQEKLGIVVYDVDMIESLIDWRV